MTGILQDYPAFLLKKKWQFFSENSLESSVYKKYSMLNFLIGFVPVFHIFNEYSNIYILIFSIWKTRIRKKIYPL